MLYRLFAGNDTIAAEQRVNTNLTMSDSTLIATVNVCLLMHTYIHSPERNLHHIRINRAQSSKLHIYSGHPMALDGHKLKG